MEALPKSRRRDVEICVIPARRGGDREVLSVFMQVYGVRQNVYGIVCLSVTSSLWLTAEFSQLNWSGG